MSSENTEQEKDILIVEPFHGGSHGQLIKLLLSDPEIGPRCDVYSLPAKKWQWRARTSALYFSQTIPSPASQYRVLFASSVLNLAELVALRTDLSGAKKIVYFHENQLVYPIRKVQDRDFQYGYNQILTSLVADVVVFNSSFNMESFLSSISSHLKLIPDHRPKNLEAQIRPKCQVLYFPIALPESDDTEKHPHRQKELTFERTGCHGDTTDLNEISSSSSVILHKTADSGDTQSSKVVSTEVIDQHDCAQEQQNDRFPACKEKEFPSRSNLCHIVWPHRWEHDKDPENFFHAMLQLQGEGCDFDLSVVGETFTDVPEIFHTAKSQLASKIVAWGYQSRQDYLRILDSAHIVVSTALHEFFGVSVLEAVSHGCYPLCPRRLVYPEIYPDECLYSTQTQLVKRLRKFCQRPSSVPIDKLKNLAEQFSWACLKDSYRNLLLQPEVVK